MFLNILKKDLKRKRAMNIILLIFITLATMFVSSSVNNILTVTTALDDYFEMAGVPDYFAATVNKGTGEDPYDTIKNAKSIDSFKTEEMFFLPDSAIIKDNEPLSGGGGTRILQSDSDMALNYFLEDNSILKSVPKGKVYMTSIVEDNTDIEIGDKITIEFEGISCDLTYAGSIKDAVLGSQMMGSIRYIVNSEDFEIFNSNESIKNSSGGVLYYINTKDVNKTVEELSGATSKYAFRGDRTLLTFSYVFDMIVTGILLVVSIILIAVAFVVLRFTITFTLSEEYREIGVMKAIGISNSKIRILYLVKYTALSVIGAVIGLGLSFPFGEMLMKVSAKSIIINNQNTLVTNILCSVLVIAVIVLFCYGCTGKVKKLSPIDAIRNGQTGERFRKKSLMSLGRSKLNTTPFLAINDLISSPKRFGIISLTFVLCLSLLLILSTSVKTLKSDTLLKCFSVSDFDLSVNNSEEVFNYMKENGQEKCKEDMAEIENTLAQNGLPAECKMEFQINLPVEHGKIKSQIFTTQGVGTTMDMYEYMEGTPPQNDYEIAITKSAADILNAHIGDTIKIETMEGKDDYLITAIYQTMANQGTQIRIYSDKKMNYLQVTGALYLQIKFTDSPDDKEISRRIDEIKKLYPQYKEFKTGAEFVEETTAVAEPLNAIKLMFSALTIILTALITVLMERSFIAKEQGEIALMKAVGIKNSKIYAYHTLRFFFVGIIAIIIGEIFAMPLTHLCIDPVFKMMGLELAVDYVVNPLEMWLIFPVIILAVTAISAYLTSLYTRKIKASDVSGIE